MEARVLTRADQDAVTHFRRVELRTIVAAGVVATPAQVAAASGSRPSSLPAGRGYRRQRLAARPGHGQPGRQLTSAPPERT